MIVAVPVLRLCMWVAGGCVVREIPRNLIQGNLAHNTITATFYHNIILSLFQTTSTHSHISNLHTIEDKKLSATANIGTCQNRSRSYKNPMLQEQAGLVLKAPYQMLGSQNYHSKSLFNT